MFMLKSWCNEQLEEDYALEVTKKLLKERV